MHIGRCQWFAPSRSATLPAAQQRPGEMQKLPPRLPSRPFRGRRPRAPLRHYSPPSCGACRAPAKATQRRAPPGAGAFRRRGPWEALGVRSRGRKKCLWNSYPSDARHERHAPPAAEPHRYSWVPPSANARRAGHRTLKWTAKKPPCKAAFCAGRCPPSRHQPRFSPPSASRLPTSDFRLPTSALCSILAPCPPREES